MPTVKISVTYDEKRLLEELAAKDLRQPEQAIRWLIRQEAERRGLQRVSQSTEQIGVTNNG